MTHVGSFQCAALELYSFNTSIWKTNCHTKFSSYSNSTSSNFYCQSQIALLFVPGDISGLDGMIIIVENGIKDGVVER